MLSVPENKLSPDPGDILVSIVYDRLRKAGVSELVIRRFHTASGGDGGKYYHEADIPEFSWYYVPAKGGRKYMRDLSVEQVLNLLRKAGLLYP
jgi:hypothetical protein